MITNQRNHNFLKWLKWISISLIIVIITGLVYGAFLLKSIEKDKNEQYTTAETEILNDSDLHSISELTHFYGESVYHIAFGTTKENKEKIVFLKQNNKVKKNNIFDANKLIPEEKIQSHWKNKCDGCSLIKINPAMIKDQPLWELTYWDSNKHYVIEYLSMQDGERYESFNFKHMF